MVYADAFGRALYSMRLAINEPLYCMPERRGSTMKEKARPISVRILFKHSTQKRGKATYRRKDPAQYMNKTNAVSAVSSRCVHIPHIFLCSTKNPAGACEAPVHIAPETRYYLLDSLPNIVIEYCKRPNGVEKISR